MTEEVLPYYQHIVESWILLPADHGEFEVIVNGETVFSKRETGRFIGEIELRMLLDNHVIK